MEHRRSALHDPVQGAACAIRQNGPGGVPRSGSFMRGFTLIELLVAIVVMSMLALLSWRSLDGMTRTQNITQQRADDLLRHGLADGMRTLRQDGIEKVLAGVTTIEEVRANS